MTMSELRGRGRRSIVGAASIALTILLLAGGASTSAMAGVDDFSFESMTADYLLERSSAGEAQLTTHERLVAVFPDTDQNHGIRRAIPMSYQGHPTQPVVTSVTDSAGNNLAFVTEESDGFLVVTISGDDFVHGRVEYDITYTQDNVILVPDNGAGIQELYWDVNGTGWAQPFGSVTARVTVSPELSRQLTSHSSCYQGPEGSTTPCAIVESEQTSNGGRVLHFGATNLAAYENLSFALGFEPNTFVVPDWSVWAHPLGIVFVSLSALMFLLMFAALLLRLIVWRNARGRGIVIAQYQAPEGMTPLVAANLVRRRSRATVAAILRLAVNGNLVIRDVDTGKKRSSGYELEIASLEKLGDEDTLVLNATFGTPLSIGSSVTTSQPDNARARRLSKLWKTTKATVVSAGFRSQPQAALRRLGMILALAIGIAVFFTGGSINVDGYGGVIDVLITYMGAFVATVTTISLLRDVSPLTVEGAQAREELRGLELFIRLAEADRIAFLQSPSGAQRRVDVTKPGKIIRLYEAALPYAVLFGLEKQWAKELAALYEQESRSPDWYSSDGQFLATAFVFSLNNLASSSTTWAASASSSSSAGSFGGGFSGGGGGGGGGGGV